MHARDVHPHLERIKSFGLAVLWAGLGVASPLSHVRLVLTVMAVLQFTESLLKLRRRRHRVESWITGIKTFGLAVLWAALASATPVPYVRVLLAFMAAVQLALAMLKALSPRRPLGEEYVHVGGGLTSSAASATHHT